MSSPEPASPRPILKKHSAYAGRVPTPRTPRDVVDFSSIAPPRASHPRYVQFNQDPIVFYGAYSKEEYDRQPVPKAIIDEDEDDWREFLAEQGDSSFLCLEDSESDGESTTQENDCPFTIRLIPQSPNTSAGGSGTAENDDDHASFMIYTPSPISEDYFVPSSDESECSSQPTTFSGDGELASSHTSLESTDGEKKRAVNSVAFPTTAIPQPSGPREFRRTANFRGVATLSPSKTSAPSFLPTTAMPPPSHRLTTFEMPPPSHKHSCFTTSRPSARQSVQPAVIPSPTPTFNGETNTKPPRYPSHLSIYECFPVPPDGIHTGPRPRLFAFRHHVAPILSSSSDTSEENEEGERVSVNEDIGKTEEMLRMEDEKEAVRELDAEEIARVKFGAVRGKKPVWMSRPYNNACLGKF